MSGSHRLFGDLAHRYDLHTPSHHYRDDHQFVLELAREVGGPTAVLLDVGCGTGVLLEKARSAGLKAEGIDISPEMVAVCERRLGEGAVRCMPMQALDLTETHDAIAVLSWSLNYVSAAELVPTVSRLAAALRPGGLVVLQIAHAAHATGAVWVDRERADPGEVTLIYRFRPGPSPASLLADYVYAWPEANELAFETHELFNADADVVTAACAAAGLDAVVYESFRRDPFRNAVSPLVVASKPAAHSSR